MGLHTRATSPASRTRGSSLSIQMSKPESSQMGQPVLRTGRESSKSTAEEEKQRAEEDDNFRLRRCPRLALPRKATVTRRPLSTSTKREVISSDG